MDTSNKFLAAVHTLAENFAEALKDVDAAKERMHVVLKRDINFAIDIGKTEGLNPNEIASVIWSDFLITACTSDKDGNDPPLARSSCLNYKSGVKKAAAHGVPWRPSSHNDLGDIVTPGMKKQGAPAGSRANTKTVTLGTVKVDRKARTLEVKLGKATDLEAFTAAITAVQSEPARVALFLAYCKAQGWTK
jgi:hypothetical protein